MGMKERNYEAPSDWPQFRVMNAEADGVLRSNRGSFCSSKTNRPSFTQQANPAAFGHLKICSAAGTGGTGGTEEYVIRAEVPRPKDHKKEKKKKEHKEKKEKGAKDGKDGPKAKDDRRPMEAPGASPFGLPLPPVIDANVAAANAALASKGQTT